MLATAHRVRLQWCDRNLAGAPPPRNPLHRHSEVHPHKGGFVPGQALSNPSLHPCCSDQISRTQQVAYRPALSFKASTPPTSEPLKRCEPNPSSSANIQSWPPSKFDLYGRGTTRAEDTQGTPTQSHISPSITRKRAQTFGKKSGLRDPGVAWVCWPCQTLSVVSTMVLPLHPLPRPDTRVVRVECKRQVPGSGFRIPGSGLPCLEARCPLVSCTTRFITGANTPQPIICRYVR